MAIRDIIRTSGDHHIQAKQDIVLETQYDGGNFGKVYIYGDLVVQGNSTEINSSDLSIGDRILILNKGEEGSAGVPAVSVEGIAGLRIQRLGGSTATPTEIKETSADLIFNENFNWTYGGLNKGLWTATASGAPWGILAAAIRTGTSSTNLSLLGIENRDAVITVEGTVDYEANVLLDDHIPNRKFVLDAITAQEDRRKLQLNYKDINDFQVVDATTTIELTEFGVPGSDATEKQARFYISNQNFVTVFSNRMNIGQLQIKNSNEITVNVANTKLVLSTQPAIGSSVNPDIEFKSSISMVIDNIYDAPAYESGKVKLYPDAEGPGGTGLYFVNNSQVRDEIPSKRRAFFASLMF